jgi:hypothetical protein
VSGSGIFALEPKNVTMEERIQKELRLRAGGLDVSDPTRVAVGESDELMSSWGIDDFILGGLEAGDYSDIME